MKIDAIDVEFKGKSDLIAVFLIQDGNHRALVETGPESCFPALEKGLKKHGVSIGDIDSVFLTHIHFDHAGAAWKFAEAGATIYVHPEGYRHMNDPARLVKSARRIYLDQMDTLWGKMEAINEDKLVTVEDQQVCKAGNLEMKAHFTPGHAKHHIAWQCGEHVFTGDVTGCRILSGPVVLPTPPPDFDKELWLDSIRKIREMKPKTLWLTHFGEVTDSEKHLDETEKSLDLICHLTEISFKTNDGKVDEQVLVNYYRAFTLAYGLDENSLDKYSNIAPHWMNSQGLSRYWSKQEQS